MKSSVTQHMNTKYILILTHAHLKLLGGGAPVLQKKESVWCEVKRSRISLSATMGGGEILKKGLLIKSPPLDSGALKVSVLVIRVSV